MNDLMLTAVLSMPYEMAMEHELSRRQFWDRAQQALAEIERLTAERDNLQRAVRHEADCVEAAKEEIERLTAALHAQPGPVSMDDVEWAGKVHLAEAIRERDELRRQLAGAEQTISDLQDALRTAVNAATGGDAMKQDARRYRDWLRGGANIPPESTRWPRWEVRHWDGRHWNTLFAEALDTSIDAAMGGSDAG